jgi:hypothetical protein
VIVCQDRGFPTFGSPHDFGNGEAKLAQW